METQYHNSKQIPPFHSPVLEVILEPHLNSKPDQLLKYLSSKIESRFYAAKFFEDQIDDLLTQLNYSITQVERINRNFCDDLRNLSLTDYARYFENIHITNTGFTALTVQKLRLMTEKYKKSKTTEVYKSPQKNHCSLCSKQMNQIKIQQIYNSLQYVDPLSESMPTQSESEEQKMKSFNQIDLLLSEIEESKQKLSRISNDKTMNSLRQVLQQSNINMMQYFNERGSFQKMTDNRDLIGVVFQQFVGKFMEVSNKNIKPNLIKCAEDLAQYLWNKRKDRIKYEDKEIQTIPDPQSKGLKNTKSIKVIKMKQKQQVDKQKNEEKIIQQKMEIMMLTKQNSNLAEKLLNLSMSMNNTPNQSYENSRQDESVNLNLSVLPVEEIFQEEPKTNSNIITIQQFKMNHIKRPESIMGRVSKQTFLNTPNFMINRERKSDKKNHRRFMTKMSNASYQPEDSRSENGDLNSQQQNNNAYANHNCLKQRGIDCETQYDCTLLIEQISIQTDPFDFRKIQRSSAYQLATHSLMSHLLNNQPNLSQSNKKNFTSGSQFNRSSKRDISKKSKQLINPLSGYNKRTSNRLGSKQRSRSKRPSEIERELLKSNQIKSELMTMISKLNSDKLKEMFNIYIKSEGEGSLASVLIAKQNNTLNNSQDPKTKFQVQQSPTNKSIQQLLSSTIRLSLKHEENINKNHTESVLEKDEQQQQDQIQNMHPSLRWSNDQNSNTLNDISNSQLKRFFSRQKAQSYHNQYSSTKQKSANQRMKTVYSKQLRNYQYDNNASLKNRDSFLQGMKQYQDYFTKQDIINIFGSLESAFEFESPKISLKTKKKRKTQCWILQIYQQVQQIKKTNIHLYYRIKSFIKFPYQSVITQFQGPTIQNSVSLSALSNLIYYVISKHEHCQRFKNLDYCEHINILLSKLKYTQQKQRARASLPKLQ